MPHFHRLVALACCCLLSWGCDSSPDKDRQIDVSPASVTLQGRGARQVFEASIPELGETQDQLPNREIIFPLVWSVSDPTRGRILSAEGTRAVYESTGQEGNNVVTVTDQANREGLATVLQVGGDRDAVDLTEPAITN